MNGTNEAPVAGWYADPTGRFEYRYWDGGAWTEHVARGGQARLDALDGSTVHGDELSAAGTGETTAIAREEHRSPAGGGASWSPDAPVSRTNSKAVLALVLSLVWVGGLGSVAGIVLGVMARGELRERPGESGSGLATAGIVLGVIGVLFTLLALAMVVSFVTYGSFSAGAPTTTLGS